jgi:hypothetical protein
VNEADVSFREFPNVLMQYLKSFWNHQNDAFRLSLATSAGCVATAGAMALCGATTAALHSAQGIALVGAFYFLLAICGARWRLSSLAVQPIAWSLRSRASLPSRRNTYRAAGGGWEHN